MNRKHMSVILLVLAILYGTTVGILAVTNSGALTIVSMIGGALLAIGWVTVSVFAKKQEDLRA